MRTDSRRECPCGCGRMLLSYNSSIPLVCYSTWQQVAPADRKIIMLPGSSSRQMLAAVRNVLRLAQSIRAQRSVAPGGAPRQPQPAPAVKGE